MARNDGMDALLSLGLLGALLANDNTQGMDKDVFEQRLRASGRSPIQTTEKKITPADGAKSAKELYDAYVQVGFNEVQAFELLKLVLTTRR